MVCLRLEVCFAERDAAGVFAPGPDVVVAGVVPGLDDGGGRVHVEDAAVPWAADQEHLAGLW